jgi:hypothetical protein
MHVNHERLLAKLSQRLAVGRGLNKQVLARLEEVRVRRTFAWCGTSATTKGQSAWNQVDNGFEK